MADHVGGIEDLDPRAAGDVAGGDDARPLRRDGHALGALDLHLEGDALQIQDDVGHVLAHAGDRTELVQDVVDLHRGDRRALQRGHQHPSQGIAQRQAEAPLERLGRERGLTRRVVPRLHVKLRRLDELGPVLVDRHGPSIPARGPWLRALPRSKKAERDRADTAPRQSAMLRRGGAWAGGRRYARSGSRRGSR